MIAVYCRVSSEEQRQSQSIRGQVSAVESYLKMQDQNPESVLWYLDDGISGVVRLEDRPQGSRLLSDAQASKFSKLIVWKLDRLGRKISIILNLVDEMERLNIAIVSLTEPFDTSTSAGRLMLNMLASFADFEHDVIVERSVSGTNARARTGQWLGGIVPYGYQVEGFRSTARLVVSETQIPNVGMSEADVVRLIYRRLSQDDRSCIQIADELNALGIPPAYVKDGRLVGKRKANTAGIWRPSRIRNLVVNPMYKGVHQYGRRSRKPRQVIERPGAAIVSPEVWQKAQETLIRKRLNASRNSHTRYLLRGLIKCGICGLTYVGTNYHSGNGSCRYYICNGKMAYRGPYQGKCPSKNVKADLIEHAVWAEIERMLLTPNEVMEKIVREQGEHHRESDTAGTDRATLERSLAAKDTERERILDLYRRELITLDDLSRQLEKITQEESYIRSRLGELDREMSAREVQEHRLKTVHDVLTDLRSVMNNGLTWEVKRQIVELLVLEVRANTVGQGQDKQLEVQVTFAFDRDAQTANYTPRDSSQQRA
jgi:site-specific DNA recombinase